MNRRSTLQVALRVVVVTILAVGLWSWARNLVPNFVRSRTSPLRGIEMCLEQVDNAKQVFAI